MYRACLHYTYSCLYYVPCTECTRLHYLFGGIECCIVYIIKVNLKVIIRRVKEKEFVNTSKGRCFNLLKY
jgi:hypothetical protein